MALDITFYKLGRTYTQIQRTREVAIYRVNHPKTAIPTYETIRIVGETYPGGRRRDTHLHTSNRLSDARLKFSQWVGGIFE